MLRSSLALTLSVASLCACSQPAPVVDEERLARRVVALLRREGLVAVLRDGGVAPVAAREADDGEDPDESAPDDPTDETADEALDAPAGPSPRVSPTPAASALAAALTARGTTAAGHRAPMPAGTAATPAVITGSGDEALVWIPLDGAATIGPADALVTVITFVDAQCPFSARLVPALRELQREHPTELRLSLRHRPLPFHASAWEGAVFTEFARAAQGADGLFNAFDQVFAHQRELDRSRLEAMAQSMGLDPLHLADALAATGPTDLDRAVARDDALGLSANVNGTPTSFFNGRRVAGALPRASLEQAFEEARERARRALSRGTRRGALYDTVCRSPDTAPPPRRTPRAP